jgi:hypothetical protein
VNDVEIRDVLFRYLDEKHAKIRVFDELVIGRARADIVAVTDRVTGFEIKGDTDTYARLPGQIAEYDRYFEENCIVVGASHRRSVERHIPEYWGIICVAEADGGAAVEVVREPQETIGFSWRKHLGLLWRSELGRILKQNGQPKYYNKRKSFLVKSALTIPKDTLRAQVCEELFERDYTL